MDILSLPLYSSLDRIQTAISGMKGAGRAGIVIQDGDQFRLATAGMILAAGPGRGEAATLASLILPSMPGVCYLTSLEMARLGLDSDRPLLVSAGGFFDLFQRIDEDFVIVNASANIATIVARSGSHARELSVAADFYCTGPRQHGYPEYRRPANDRCSRCGAPVVCYPREVASEKAARG